jgi:hypothetical protein
MSLAQRKRGWLVSSGLLVICLAGLSGWLPQVRAAAAGDDLLNLLLIQNEEARKKVATVSYRFEFQSEVTADVQGANLPAKLVRGPRSIQIRISGEEFKKGKWRYSSMDQQHKTIYLKNNQTEEQNRLERAVLNDDCAASWRVGSIYAYQFDHKSLSTMSEREEAHLLLQSIDPIAYGFGPGRYTMTELYQKVKDKTPFRAEKSVSDGRTVYRIKQFSSKISNADQPICVYVVDPDKGFLITSFTAYHQDSSVEREYKVEVEKVQGHDIWLPARIHEKAHRQKSEVTEHLPQLRKTVQIKLSDIRVNEPIEDEKFTVAALQLTDKVCLMREMLDGQVVPMLRKDGVWLPSGTRKGAVDGTPNNGGAGPTD